MSASNRLAPIDLHEPYVPRDPCKCASSTVVWKMYGKDRRTSRECDDCGKHMGWIKKTDPVCASAVPHRGIQDAKWRLEQAERDAERQRKSEAWWSLYNEYLLSPEWAERRRKVIEREGGICQGCMDVDGTQVHHLTYDRVGRELLTDLVLLCDACHKNAHDKDGVR